MKNKDRDREGQRDMDRERVREGGIRKRDREGVREKETPRFKIPLKLFLATFIDRVMMQYQYIS